MDNSNGVTSVNLMVFRHVYDHMFDLFSNFSLLTVITVSVLVLREKCSIVVCLLQHLSLRYYSLHFVQTSRVFVNILQNLTKL